MFNIISICSLAADGACPLAGTEDHVEEEPVRNKGAKSDSRMFQK